MDRVLGFFSSRRKWSSPICSPTGEMSHPLLVQEGANSLAGEGVGEWSPNSDEGTGTGVLQVYTICTSWERRLG